MSSTLLHWRTQAVPSRQTLIHTLVNTREPSTPTITITRAQKSQSNNIQRPTTDTTSISTIQRAHWINLCSSHPPDGGPRQLNNRDRRHWCARWLFGWRAAACITGTSAADNGANTHLHACFCISTDSSWRRRRWWWRRWQWRQRTADARLSSGGHREQLRGGNREPAEHTEHYRGRGYICIYTCVWEMRVTPGYTVKSWGVGK